MKCKCFTKSFINYTKVAYLEYGNQNVIIFNETLRSTACQKKVSAYFSSNNITHSANTIIYYQ